MRVNEHAQHAERLIVLDEPHAAHIGGQVETDIGALQRGEGTVAIRQVQSEILDVGEPLVPLGGRLAIHGPNRPEAALPEFGYEGATNESTGPAHHNLVGHIHVRSRNVARG